MGFVLNAVILILEAKEFMKNSDCPYCDAYIIIRYGHKCINNVSFVKPVSVLLVRL